MRYDLISNSSAVNLTKLTKLNQFNKLILKLSFGGLALILAACDNSGSSNQTNTNQDNSSNTTQNSSQANSNNNSNNSKTYRVVSEHVKPPLIVYAAGKASGFEYDLLEAIAKKKNITFQYDVVSTRPELLNSIINKKADIATGAITITDERQKEVDFSNPIVESSTAVLVTKNLANVNSLAELRGKKIASRQGTIYEKMALNELAQIDSKGVINNNNIHYYETVWLEFKNVMSGLEEVMLGDNLILEYYVNEHDKERKNVDFVKNLNFPVAHYGFAIQKGNTELQKLLNDGLAELKADGTYDKIYQTYWSKK